MMPNMRWRLPTPPLLLVSLLVALPAGAADVPAGPGDYLTKLASLQPGDRLLLDPGDYTGGLRIDGLNGTETQPIVIEGAAGLGSRLVGRACCNTVDIENASYVVLRGLLLDGDGEYVDAIKAGGAADSVSHHITVEGCTIINHDVGQTGQQAVGISTKIVSWDWVVRGNTIGDASHGGAGTGMYFGNSDGTRAFIGGVIEGNLFYDTLGYNMQIKHQLARESLPGVPTDPRTVVIRHNVFIKSNNPSPDGGRPNLLVDGPPDSGPGSDDHVEIYGNFFFHNDEDSLLQASGRVHIHDNVFVDSANSAVRLASPHGKPLLDAVVYNNTIYATARGISFPTPPSGLSLVAGNAIFSPEPFYGVSGEIDNVTDSVAAAGSYVNAPSLSLGAMDFYPSPGSALHGAAVDVSAASADLDHDRDFNGTVKDFSYRGAYHGEGQNPGWNPDGTLKPIPDGSSSGSGGGSSSGSGGGSSSGSGGGSSSGSGGASSSGGLPSSSGNALGGDDEDSGCGCELAGAPAPPQRTAWLLATAALWLGRRRRRR